MLEKILKYLFFVVFCITPFVFTKLNSELFEFNKMILIYASVISISGIWILRMVSLKKVIFSKTPLDIPIFLFLLSQIISTIYSMDPHTSVWGYYSRSNGGLLSTLSYILLYYAFVSNFTKEDLIPFLRGSVIAGGIAALYAIPEHFGLSPSCIILTHEATAGCWVQDVQARVFGTLGQPNWLAAYLGMLIFPAIYFFIEAKTKIKKILWWLLVAAYYLAFTFTYSRGATLGIIGGGIVFGISIAIAEFKSRKFTNLKLFSIIAASLIFLSLLFGSALNDFRLLSNPAVPLRPSIAQSAQSGTQLENGGTESGRIRLIVWRGAIDIFKAHPLFGSGVETFAYSYYQFRPEEHNLVSEWDFLYNKAHNEYLNYLATTGAFGFGSYMLIILVFIGFCTAKILKQKSETHEYLILVSLLSGYISYLIQNFFLFSVVIIAVFFYLFPAFAFLANNAVKEISQKNLITNPLNKLFLLIHKSKISFRVVQIFIVLIMLVMLNNVISLWEADTLYKKGSDYNDVGNPGRAYNYLIEAVRLNIGEPLYLGELGNAAASSAIALANDDPTTSAELKDDSVTFTELGLKISPVNTTLLRTAIRTYFQLTLIDPKYKQKTLDIVNQSINLAPTDPKLLLNKAVILNQFEQYPEAIASLKKALELKPDYREAHLQLGDLYIKTNQKPLAAEQANIVLKAIPNDPDALKLLEEAK